MSAKYCHVMTLEKGRLSWRVVECHVPHSPECDGICINGALYYIALKTGYDQTSMIVCLDVRSEKLKFITNPAGENKNWLPTIINYKGKLGALEAVDWEGMLDGRKNKMH